MIRHIVLFKLLEFPSPEEKLAAAKKVREELLKLKSTIPFIFEFEVGINFCSDSSAWDVAINSLFKSKEDLKSYQIHPDHLAFVAFNKNFSAQKAVIDYELSGAD